jgi:hypothetical protein
VAAAIHVGVELAAEVDQEAFLVAASDRHQEFQRFAGL